MEKAPDAFRTISEVADELDVPQHVLRFWETRFAQIRPMKRGGGRRYYRPDDVDLLRGIRHLLYGEGYTIRGVQRLLKDNGIKFIQSVWRDETAAAEAHARPEANQADAEAGASNGDAAAAEDAAEADSALDAAPALSRGPAVVPPMSRFVLQRANPQPVREPPREFDLNGSEGEADAGAPAQPTLSREDLHRLQSALYELGECRRLIEAAFRDPD
ncbi:MAG TPA: MerR family transcriptional regulator [Xanthobacteraceae bacterium]